MSDDSFFTEEDVRVKFLVPYLRDRGYDEKCIDYEVAIEVQEGSARRFSPMPSCIRARDGLLLCCYARRNTPTSPSPNPPANKLFPTPAF